MLVLLWHGLVAAICERIEGDFAATNLVTGDWGRECVDIAAIAQSLYGLAT